MFNHVYNQYDSHNTSNSRPNHISSPSPKHKLLIQSLLQQAAASSQWRNETSMRNDHDERHENKRSLSHSGTQLTASSAVTTAPTPASTTTARSNSSQRGKSSSDDKLFMRIVPSINPGESTDSATNTMFPANLPKVYKLSMSARFYNWFKTLGFVPAPVGQHDSSDGDAVGHRLYLLPDGPYIDANKSPDEYNSASRGAPLFVPGKANAIRVVYSRIEPQVVAAVERQRSGEPDELAHEDNTGAEDEAVAAPNNLQSVGKPNDSLGDDDHYSHGYQLSWSPSPATEHRRNLVEPSPARTDIEQRVLTSSSPHLSPPSEPQQPQYEASDAQQPTPIRWGEQRQAQLSDGYESPPRPLPSQQEEQQQQNLDEESVALQDDSRLETQLSEVEYTSSTDARQSTNTNAADGNYVYSTSYDNSATSEKIVHPLLRPATVGATSSPVSTTAPPRLRKLPNLTSQSAITKHSSQASYSTEGIPTSSAPLEASSVRQPAGGSPGKGGSRQSGLGPGGGYGHRTQRPKMMPQMEENEYTDQELSSAYRPFSAASRPSPYTSLGHDPTADDSVSTNYPSKITHMNSTMVASRTPLTALTLHLSHRHTQHQQPTGASDERRSTAGDTGPVTARRGRKYHRIPDDQDPLSGGGSGHHVNRDHPPHHDARTSRSAATSTASTSSTFVPLMQTCPRHVNPLEPVGGSSVEWRGGTNASVSVPQQGGQGDPGHRRNPPAAPSMHDGSTSHKGSRSRLGGGIGVDINMSPHLPNNRSHIRRSSHHRDYAAQSPPTHHVIGPQSDLREPGGGPGGVFPPTLSSSSAAAPHTFPSIWTSQSGRSQSAQSTGRTIPISQYNHHIGLFDNQEPPVVDTSATTRHPQSFPFYHPHNENYDEKQPLPLGSIPHQQYHHYDHYHQNHHHSHTINNHHQHNHNNDNNNHHHNHNHDNNNNNHHSHYHLDNSSPSLMMMMHHSSSTKSEGRSDHYHHDHSQRLENSSLMMTMGRPDHHYHHPEHEYENGAHGGNVSSATALSQISGIVPMASLNGDYFPHHHHLHDHHRHHHHHYHHHHHDLPGFTTDGRIDHLTNRHLLEAPAAQPMTDTILHQQQHRHHHRSIVEDPNLLMVRLREERRRAQQLTHG